MSAGGAADAVATRFRPGDHVKVRWADAPGHVRFVQARVWPDYGGSPLDTVDVEIYQHWLEPA